MADRIVTIQNGAPRPMASGTDASTGDGLIVLATSKSSGAAAGGVDGDVHLRVDGADTGLAIKIDTDWKPILAGPSTITADAVVVWDSAGNTEVGPEIGTSADNLVQLDGTAKLPAVDASQLTNIPDQHTHANKTELDTIDQDLATTDSPVFAGLTVGSRDVDTLIEGIASSTDSAILLFDGAGGDLAKEGPLIGTSANNVIQLDSSAKLPAVDGSQLLNLPGLEAVYVTVTQASHGFSEGDVIKVAGTDTFALAQANSETNSQAVGVVSRVIDSSNFEYTALGMVEEAAAVPNFAAGTTLYLDPITPGNLTATEPTTTGEYIRPMARIVEPDQKMLVLEYLPRLVGMDHIHSNKARLDVIDQNLSTTSSVTFSGVTIGTHPAVKGPSSTTEDYVPQWDATTNLLKDGLALGTAAGNLIVLIDVSGSPGLPAVDGTNLTGVTHGPSSSVIDNFATFTDTVGNLEDSGLTTGTSANNIVQLNGSAELPAVDGSNLTGDLVHGPASSTDGFVVLFDGTTGKLVKNSTIDPDDLVVGPVSSTDSAVALYDGTSGDTLKDGPAIGTAANNLVQLDGSGDLPAVSGTNLTGDVVHGPGSSVDAYVPQWDGTTGTSLDGGLAVGTAANNLVQLDGSGDLPAVSGENLTNLPNDISVTFSYQNVGDSLTDENAVIAGTNNEEMPVPKGGSLIGISARANVSITSGTITIEPTINGSDVTPSDLDLSLDSGNQQDYATVAAGTAGFTFSAGNFLGIHMTTDSSVEPNTVDIVITLYYRMTY